MSRIARAAGLLSVIILGLWLVLETGLRLYLEAPLQTDFYGSVGRGEVAARQVQVGVRSASGPGWIHLGWVADPENETYTIQRHGDSGWEPIGTSRFGSFLLREAGGTYRVQAITDDGRRIRTLGEVTAHAATAESLPRAMHRAGPWQVLFRPSTAGHYVNDHAIYQDAQGDWRLAGITSMTNGEYTEEKYFVTAVSESFPPDAGMSEVGRTADFGELAWAPDVFRAEDTYHMVWSPHRLQEMTSSDGIDWENHRIAMSAPYHKYFRDAMVLRLGNGQWLMYATARGAYYSQVDVYQSFDLQGWQYIGTALRSGWGSERNSPFSSMESPFVIAYQDHYYLSITYNNDSFFWPGILLTFKVWLDPASYNDTLVFHSDNPYDFGEYRGRSDAPTLLTVLRAHAPEYIHVPQTDTWYMTTAGWPWVSTLTHGEVAVAPIEWTSRP